MINDRLNGRKTIDSMLFSSTQCNDNASFVHVIIAVKVICVCVCVWQSAQHNEWPNPSSPGPCDYVDIREHLNIFAQASTMIIYLFINAAHAVALNSALIVELLE